MGKPTGFLEITRQDRTYAPVADRLQHYREFIVPLDDSAIRNQGARCMDCGIPFCHNGCPVNNIIPDWNDLIYKGNWKEALDVLHSTNNFPEFTGRICPAPCEEACTLNLTDAPVTIKSIECAIIDKGWENGWLQPQIPAQRTGKKVAIVGSGPAGLACAQQLARAGHEVVVFEKNDRCGGLLRYGIPDFKMEKQLIDRRIAQMQAEGVVFIPNTWVGSKAFPAKKLLETFDSIVLAGGSEQPRDLPAQGRDLQGIYFAMDFLRQQNRMNAGDVFESPISAKGKHVIVIGGGDTGSDCIGTSNRQGAASVTQIEILPKPPEKAEKLSVWPHWQIKMRTSSSHLEGCVRDWSVVTKRFEGENGKITKIHLARVDAQLKEIPNSDFELAADLVFLAMGFVNPVYEGLLAELGVALDARKNVKADTEGTNAYQTSIPQIFAAGDMRRGQSLVVWAIREGRQAARAVDEYLMGCSNLPR